MDMVVKVDLYTWMDMGMEGLDLYMGMVHVDTLQSSHRIYYIYASALVACVLRVSVQHTARRPPNTGSGQGM